MLCELVQEGCLSGLADWRVASYLSCYPRVSRCPCSSWRARRSSSGCCLDGRGETPAQQLRIPLGALHFLHSRNKNSHRRKHISVLHVEFTRGELRSFSVGRRSNGVRNSAGLAYCAAILRIASDLFLSCIECSKLAFRTDNRSKPAFKVSC